MAAVGYFTVTVLQVPSLLFEEPDEPRNLLIVEPDQGLSDALDARPIRSRGRARGLQPSCSSCGGSG